MTNNPFSREHEKLQELLREIRREKGFSQVGLANRLGRPQSYVSKYESGERRLDVVEVWEICRALGTPFEEFARRLKERIG